MSSDNYFAAKEAKDSAAHLLSKANSWYQRMYTNNYFDTIERSYMAYHSMFSNGESHDITFSGEQGEIANIDVNHYANIAQHMLTMITSTKPSFVAKASNADNKSIIQSKLATNLIEYYLREKKLEKYLRYAVEYALVLGTGYIKLEWNATRGEIYDVDEETGTPIYEGDVEFRNLSPFDVLHDFSRAPEDQDWVLCRTFKNKYDLAAKFPDQEREIKNLKTKSELYRFRMSNYEFDETDDVPVYEFYHKKTESLPNGRYLLFLSEDIILIDQANPYPDLPVYRISARDVLGTSFGYSPMFPLLPLQDALNTTYSAILTNQSAFAIQNIFVPNGSDISLKSLEGGMNIIEGNQKPEPINFTNTPAEVYNFARILEQQMETISGINSVARGNPEASLKSGTALALVQSTALQYMTGLQQQYIRLMEDVGTGLVNLLKVFAQVPRIALIAGVANRGYVEKEFNADDLKLINRVMVEVGNPLSQTHAGRAQMATDLLQFGAIKSAEQYITVITSGRLDVTTDPVQRNTNLVRAENEKMMMGISVKMLNTDPHLLHIQEHQAILADPDMRENELITGIVMEHILEHINALKTTDPGLLQILGQTPLPPDMPPQGLPPGSEAPNMQQGPMGPVPSANEPANMPNMPQVDASLMMNPDAQEAVVGNVNFNG